MSIYDLNFVVRVTRQRRMRQTETRPIREGKGWSDRPPSAYDLSRPGAGLSCLKRKQP